MHEPFEATITRHKPYSPKPPPTSAPTPVAIPDRVERPPSATDPNTLSMTQLRELLRHAGPDNRDEVRSILRGSPDSAAEKMHALLEAQPTPTELPPDYTHIDPHVTGSIVSLSSLQEHVANPDSSSLDLETASLRLRGMLQKNGPTLANVPLKTGDGVITIQMEGIKGLNAAVGINISQTVLEIVRREILRELFAQKVESDLSALAQPLQESWKGFVIRVEDLVTMDHTSAKLDSVIRNVKARLKLILERQGIEKPVDEILQLFDISTGYALADREYDDAYDVWQHAQTRLATTRIDRYRETITQMEGFAGLPKSLRSLIENPEQFESIYEGVDRDDMALSRLFTTAGEIRTHLVGRLKELGLEDGFLAQSEDVSDHDIFSRTLLTLARKGRDDVFIQALSGKGVDSEESMLLCRIMKFYTEIVTAPTLIKDFTFDEIEAAHSRNRSILIAIKKALQRDPGVFSDERTMALLEYDQRFAEAENKGPILSEVSFHQRAANMPSAHYVSMDLRDIGVDLLDEAQRRELRIAPQLSSKGIGESTKMIMEETRTLSENGWRTIQKTFTTFLDKLRTDETLRMEYPMTDIVAFAKGDELTIAVNGAVVDQEVLQGVISRIQKELHTGGTEGRARITMAETSRETSTSQTLTRHTADSPPPARQLSEHLHALVIVESLGMWFAKIVEHERPNEPFVAQIKETPEGPLARAHFADGRTSPWLNANSSEAKLREQLRTYDVQSRIERRINA